VVGGESESNSLAVGGKCGLSSSVGSHSFGVSDSLDVSYFASKALVGFVVEAVPFSASDFFNTVM